MSQSLPEKCCDLIEELGLGRREEVRDVTPLTGGVASDIAALRVGDTRYCVKLALPKLKVAADWRAPVHRNAAEYAWLEVAARVVPQSAVRLFGRSEHAHGFVMEFLDGPDVHLWKTAMLEGTRPNGEARAVGDVVGRIHAVSSGDDFDRSAFRNRDDFRALRIEPYLISTAGRHPELEARLHDLADVLYRSDQVLVHGDVSPKNILMRNGGPVILDAECATMGDASFDPSFCLNHLVLKAIHLPGMRAAFLGEIARFWEGYGPHVSWEEPADLEARVCRLLPALMLARIDGKSPVEYLDETRRQQVRALAQPMIVEPVQTLSDLTETLKARLKDLDA